jgi:hypothetical protein
MNIRRVVFAVVFLLITTGVAWAGKEAYTLVMSKDKTVCTRMLAIFNADMKKERALMYEEHKEFVVWEPVDTGELLLDKYCSQTLKQAFDINNDGTDELVIRRRHCFQSQLTDRLYIFPLDSNAVELLKDPNAHVLDTTGDRLEFQTYELKKMPGTKAGAQFPGVSRPTLEPFIFGQTFYVSMTDLRQEFIVIAKYLHGEELDDVCYFRGKPLI